MEKLAFTRAERLSGKTAFDHVFKRGRAFRSAQVTVIACPNGECVSRLGLSVGRRLGRAVRRNRIKRILREAFRLNKEVLQTPCDLVVIPSRRWEDLRLGAIEHSFRNILTRVSEAFAE